MSDLPEAGAKLTLDLTEWESNWASAIADAESLQSTIDDLGGTVDIEFNVEDAALPFDDIPESTETEVNVTEDETSKSILDGLNFLVAIEKIKIAISVVGNVLEFAEKISSFVATPFLDVEDAVAKINAQTGGEGIKNLGQFIRDIQAADLGTSVDQITDVIIAARQLGAPIEEATTAALTFTHTFDDQDPVTVLTTLNTLVETGLVPNLQAAADLMTVAFQQGVNKGNDALQVVNANAQSWADMGLNGTQALSAINSLQDAGVDSATDAAKMIQTLDDALTAAAANADSPQAEALKTLGMENPKDSGQAMGADFIDGFASSFANLPTEQQDLISGVLFGKGGKKFTGALEGLTTQGGPFEDVVGAAADAATAIDDSLRGAIDDFILEINTKISELLSSKSIDLPGKIDALKKGFQEAVDVLASGGTFGEAIEVGLNIPGFADGIDRFEASVGSFAISVLEIIAGIQEFLGKDSSGTRSQIAAMEKNQLPFDLKVANADEISTEVNTAIGRGLSTNDILKAAGTAVNELIAGGKTEDIDKAQALVDSIKDLGGGYAVNPAVSASDQLFADRALKHQDQANIDYALQQGLLIPTTIDTAGLQTQIDDAITKLNTHFGPNEGRGVGVNPFASLDKLLPAGGGASGGLGGFATGFQDAVDSLTTLDDATTTAATNMGTNWNNLNVSVTDSTAAVVTAMDNTAAKVSELDATVGEKLTGNTVTASFDAVSASAAVNFPAVIAWFDRTAKAAITFDSVVSVHLRSVIKQLNDLNFLAMVTIGNVTQAQQLGGAGGVTNNTTNNVTVNNNVNGPAAASANGYAIGASLRPGGG